MNAIYLVDQIEKHRKHSRSGVDKEAKRITTMTLLRRIQNIHAIKNFVASSRDAVTLAMFLKMYSATTGLVARKGSTEMP